MLLNPAEQGRKLTDQNGNPGKKGPQSPETENLKKPSSRPIVPPLFQGRQATATISHVEKLLSTEVQYVIERNH